MIQTTIPFHINNCMIPSASNRLRLVFSFNPDIALEIEFDEKDGHFFDTKKLNRSLNYAFTFLCQKNTHLFRLGSKFLMQNPGLTRILH